MVNMKVVVMAFTMIMMLAGMPASVKAQSETGLVGEWHFDGDAKDSSGNGNDGTINGASFVDGKFGKAASFDGEGDYISVQDSDNWAFGTGDFTISFWVNLGNVNVHNGFYEQYIDANNFITIYRNSNSNIQFGVNHRGTYLAGYYAAWTPIIDTWHQVIWKRKGTNIYLYIDAVQITLTNWATVETSSIPNFVTSPNIGKTLVTGSVSYMNGLIDEVRIYNRALSPEEVKQQYEQGQTALTLTKTASPYSINQGQTTTITLTIENTGTTDITNIEVMDSIHRNFDLISGDFPNPRKFDIIGKGESREIQYMIKAKEGGTFNLDPATGIYADKDGNIQEAKSEPFSVKVITSFEPTPAKTSAPASTPEPTTNPVKTASVSLYGEKTDVVLGEDILLKLSAVNLITKPMMHVQVIIIPPSGMSVTSSEFSKIAAGQFTANYELPPGDGRDIEVSIKSNQIGDFNVNGRIIYYFGDEKGTAEDHNLNLPIKVRKEIGSDTAHTQTPAQKSIPGFELFTGISGLFLLAAILKRKR